MDLIFYNGRVLTIDYQQQEARAVAVKAGKIAAVGDDSEVLALKSDMTTMVDLAGRTLVPGFNDSHMHLLSHALTAEKVDLRHCKGIEQVIAEIQDFIRKKRIKTGEWVFGWGWDQVFFNENRMPEREDLDRASLEHPVAIMRTCCHILSVNSAALKKAGIDRQPAKIRGGNVVTGLQGLPTGVLEEKAMRLVMDLFPPMDRDMLKELIKSAAEDFIAAGLTSVQTDDLTALGGKKSPLLVDTYRELELSGELPLRINLQALLPTMDELQYFLKCGYRTGQGSDMFKIGPLKLLTDGSIGGRTALVSTPYEDDPENYGVVVLPRSELKQLVRLAYENDMQVAVHAIGDTAVNMVLDVYEETTQNFPRSDPRFRIIHVSMSSPSILERFEEQNVIADIQPSFIPSDHVLVDRHLGLKRAAWTYRWKDFIERGIRLAGGSDCPVESYKPLEGIHAAVTRQDKNGNPPGGWFPDQCLSLEQALYIYTMGSACCTFEENIKGSITEGKLADLVVLSEDIKAAEPSMIRDIEVDMTIVGGNIAYSRYNIKNGF